MAGASSSCFSRRMSAVAYRWSSHATSGSSGRKTPSRRPSTTSVNRELAGPVASTRRDPTEGHAQEPKPLMGGDANLGRSGHRWAHLGDGRSTAGVVAVVGHIRPDLAGGPVDLYAAHHPHQWPSRSASNHANRLQYRRLGAASSSTRRRQAFQQVSVLLALAFLASSAPGWQGAHIQIGTPAAEVVTVTGQMGPGQVLGRSRFLEYERTAAVARCLAAGRPGG
jgi:hypothetical protein